MEIKNKPALLLVAAVAAETPQRKWRIGHTLIQFTINKTSLDGGPHKHVVLPYVALFKCAAAPLDFLFLKQVCDIIDMYILRSKYDTSQSG